MKPGAKTALGIHISETKISLALLKRDGKGIKLLKTADCSMPDAAVKDGNVKDPEVLCKTIQELRVQNKIRTHQAVISLMAKPVFMQIADMPKQAPSNIGQFVQNEIKQCVALSGKKALSDYCGVGSAGTSSRRIFMVATDGGRVAELVRACNQAGVTVEVIEPSVLACARALFSKRISAKFDSLVLLALVEESSLTLCVFRKSTLDFVRTKAISVDLEPEGLCQELAAQINAIIQFYDMEVPPKSGNWEINIVANDVSRLSADVEGLLKAKIGERDLTILSPENVYKETSLSEDENAEKAHISAAAIGLAMRHLNTDDKGLRVNLLPPEAAEVKSFRKHMLVTANIVAAVLFVTVLVVSGLTFFTERTNAHIIRQKHTQSLQGIGELVEQEKLLETRIKQLSEAPRRLEEILNSRQEVDWPVLLNDIRNSAPKTVRLTSLLSKDGLTMTVSGVALSYESVHTFVKMLDKSQHIGSASLIEVEKDSDRSGLVKYMISCLLVPKEGV